MRRKAMEIIKRVTPDMMMLMPNSVPTTHSVFSGQWAQIRTPSKNGHDGIEQDPSPAGVRTHVKRQHQRDDAVDQQEASEQ